MVCSLLHTCEDLLFTKEAHVWALGKMDQNRKNALAKQATDTDLA